jgi:glycosyltransferase involved in cell wall biosynthesis
MRKKRVLVLEQQSFRGGGQRVLEVVLEGLRDQIDPIVALPEHGPFECDLERRHVETMTYALGRYRSGRKSLTDFVVFTPRSIRATLQLSRTIVRRQVDLVMINGPRCLLSGALAARLTGRASLFCLHNTLSRSSDVMLAAQAAGLVSRVVACSRAAAEPLLRANPALKRKLQVLYPPLPGTPIPARSGPPATGPLVVGMVGRITEAKGHHVLIEALAQLGPAPGIRLLIVGAPAPESRQDARYVRSLHDSAARCGVASLVNWVGYQADPQPYYASMNVLTVPSIVEEGMPVVALEACQRGIPVVASCSGGIPELVEHGVNGLLFKTGDPSALAEALQRLRESPALRAQLAAAARTSIDARFSPKLYCSTLGGMISDLCSPRRRSEAIRALESTGD